MSARRRTRSLPAQRRSPEWTSPPRWWPGRPRPGGAADPVGASSRMILNAVRPGRNRPITGGDPGAPPGAPIVAGVRRRVIAAVAGALAAGALLSGCVRGPERVTPPPPADAD